MRISMIAWLIGLVVIVGLYTIGPAAGFNTAGPAIWGMPRLYFWFVLVPVLNPFILGAVYLIDRTDNGTDDEQVGE